MTYTAEQIIGIGGNEWIRNGRHRVYLPDSAILDILGLEIDYYKSGNIGSATRNGQPISNSEAGRLSNAIDKVYWDSTSSGIIIQWGYHAHRYDKEELAALVRDWVASKVAALAGGHDDRPLDPDTTGQTPDSTPQDTPGTPHEPMAMISALRAAGRTVRDIAAAIGVHASTVYRWARGQFRPTPARAAALAALSA